MIPSAYTNFLVASTQASAALIGLLFVSVSISPERVFGSRAEAGRQAMALSSFTALANVFFVSFSSLIPNVPYGVFVVIAGIIAAGQTLALLALVSSWRRERILIRSLTLFAVSGVVYGYEIAIGVHLISAPSNSGWLTTLLEVLLGGYTIGLARAWELLGAPRGRSLFSTLGAWLASRFGAPAGAAGVPKQPAEPVRQPEDRT
jgi:hypothetical protein